jgi:glycosyltransferase involved in cell wall biosynthesis
MNVCMVAYALYLNDARIKAYVKSLEGAGANVDILVVREAGKKRLERRGTTRIFYLTSQYRGNSAAGYVWSYCKFFVMSFFVLTYLSLRARYDAVHVHNMPNLLVFTAVVSKLRGAKVILDVHDLMAPNYMAKFAVGEDHGVVKCLVLEQRISALMSTCVLCADHYQREYLATVCRIPAEKLSVVLNLPNEETFKLVAKPRRRDRFELVYHGTIARRLGIDILLDAVARVPGEIPVHLSIYGTGDFLAKAQEIADQLRLGGKVCFSGSFFPVEMIPEMVGGMDLGVVGNRRTLACDRFMLPVKLLEYVYLGVPVVAPRLAIIRRYFDEDMIKYYEPEDAGDLARCIVELYQHPEECRRLARNASRFYDQYNWHRQAEAYLATVSGMNPV